MNVEAIINGLIVTVLGWIIVFVGKKIFNDWFYIQILFPNKKEKEKNTDEIPVETKEGEGKDEDRKKDKKNRIIKKYQKIEVDFGNWEGLKRSGIPKTEYEVFKKDQYYIIPGSKTLFPESQAS